MAFRRQDLRVKREDLRQRKWRGSVGEDKASEVIYNSIGVGTPQSLLTIKILYILAGRNFYIARSARFKLAFVGLGQPHASTRCFPPGASVR